MAHKVLKPFPFAEDGHTTRQVKIDEILHNIEPGLVPGLIEAGYIVAATSDELASKAAGEAIAAAAHTGVDSQAAVDADMAQAKAHISDGLIGAPEAAAIVDQHKVAPLAAATPEALDAMTVAELKDYAAERQIDLGDATLKADIRAAIDKAQA